MTLTEKLTDSIKTELLKKFVDHAYNRLYADPQSFDLEELENLERAASLLKESGIAITVDHEIEKRK